MATNNLTIRLEDGNREDYQAIFNELEKLPGSGKQYMDNSKLDTRGGIKFRWSGQSSIQEIANVILNVAYKKGRKYSFSIIKDKPAYS